MLSDAMGSWGLRGIFSGVLSALLLAVPSSAIADLVDLQDPVNQWLPSSDGASWTYQWSDDTYAPTPTKEQYTLTAQQGTAFRIDWTTDGLDNGDGTVPGAGLMQFENAEAGLINGGWSSTPAPAGTPILCAQAASCANSLSGTLFMVIWGTRSPTLTAPLLRGTDWASTGGADNDVGSLNHYLGVERVIVPAFPDGVDAAKVESTVTQAGALGDPYGSGIRTVWWVYGVGPVKVVFKHTGGERSESELLSTNVSPIPAPSDVRYLPFVRGDTMTYRWKNNKHMKKPSTQRFTVSDVVNNTARVDVQTTDGPINLKGSYIFATRLGGITNVAASTASQSVTDFPPLGPRSARRDQRRHLLTPYDLMTFGFNPVLPAYPERGDKWESDRDSTDFKVFGVNGWSRVEGFAKVRTPAGRFKALKVRSKLKQPGFPFGSGHRTSYFAAGEGLVKLVFHHHDGSVSTVVLLH